MLVQGCGRLLSKESLVSTLWPDRFVEESNLTQNVFVLRKALNGGADSESFIETVPRRGYRFIADVRESDEDAAKSPRVSERRRTRPLLLPAASLVVVVAVIVFISLRRPVMESRPERVRAMPGVSRSAQEAYLKGRYHWNRRTVGPTMPSVIFARRSIWSRPSFRPMRFWHSPTCRKVSSPRRQANSKPLSDLAVRRIPASS